ncbi:hypothetical protein SAMN05720606_10878 [Paenibacillus polysaccharolyticus]|uniref:Uncharacterized protein n=2 Tax=Paenibacillus polysaccharolyticus TaxID=582692 RepID=A0A1G5I6N6_9BACL|nr:hypothetical protein SAMN05720606_10878 [Paenibacillus polysaccharolyticus]
MSTTTKTKKLTATALNTLDAKNNKRKKIYVTEQHYEVQIHTFFRKSLIDNVNTNYLSIIDQLRQKTDVTDQLIKDTVGLYNTLLLKEFTDLPIPKKLDVEKLIKVTNMLLDNGIMEEVLTQFPEQELKKLEEQFRALQERMAAMVSELAITRSQQVAHESAHESV